MSDETQEDRQGSLRWPSHVDIAAAMKTLRSHHGECDLEDSVVRGESQNHMVERETQTHFPTGSTRAIEEVPLGAIYATIALSWNAVVMLVAEVIIEALVLLEAYPKLPFRTSFLFLTILSGLLGTQTLIAVNRKELDTSHNALAVGLLVEIALITGDIAFLVSRHKKYPVAIPTRVPFIILTAVNVGLVIYLYNRLHLYEWHTEYDVPECVRPVDLGVGTLDELRRSIVPPIGYDRRAWTLQGLGDAVAQHLTEIEDQQLFGDHDIDVEIDIAPDDDLVSEGDTPVRVQASGDHDDDVELPHKHDKAV